MSAAYSCSSVTWSMAGAGGTAIAGTADTRRAAIRSASEVAAGTDVGRLSGESDGTAGGVLTGGTQAAAATGGAVGAVTCGTAGSAGGVLGGASCAGVAIAGLAIEAAGGAVASTGGVASSSRSSHSIQLVAHSAISRSHREHRFIHTTPESTDVPSRNGKARTEDDRSELPLWTMWSRTVPRPAPTVVVFG